MIVLPDAEDSTIVYCIFVWAKHRNATGRQRERQSVAIAAVCIASNADAL